MTNGRSPDLRMTVASPALSTTASSHGGSADGLDVMGIRRLVEARVVPRPHTVEQRFSGHKLTMRIAVHGAPTRGAGLPTPAHERVGVTGMCLIGRISIGAARETNRYRVSRYACGATAR